MGPLSRHRAWPWPHPAWRVPRICRSPQTPHPTPLTFPPPRPWPWPRPRPAWKAPRIYRSPQTPHPPTPLTLSPPQSWPWLRSRPAWRVPAAQSARSAAGSGPAPLLGRGSYSHSVRRGGGERRCVKGRVKSGILLRTPVSFHPPPQPPYLQGHGVLVTQPIHQHQVLVAGGGLGAKGIRFAALTHIVHLGGQGIQCVNIYRKKG